MSSKYNVSSDVSKRTFEGIVYDSAIEMRFMRDYIKPRLESGELISAERQVKYELQPSFRHNGELVRAINYVADFVITYVDGHKVVVDIKGYPDSVALLKRKLFYYRYPDIDYQWLTWVKKFGGWITYDEYKMRKRTEKKE